MDLYESVDIHFARLDKNIQMVIVTYFCYRFLFFILISFNIKVLIILHTKFQPNIPSHSGENADFIGFTIFSNGNLLEFLTRLNYTILKP